MSEPAKPSTLHLLQDATIASWALEQYDRIEMHGYRLTIEGDIEDAVELARKTGQIDEKLAAR